MKRVPQWRTHMGVHFDEADVEAWEERAAIKEHSGGMSKDLAEYSAYRDQCAIMGIPHIPDVQDFGFARSYKKTDAR